MVENKFNYSIQNHPYFCTLLPVTVAADVLQWSYDKESDYDLWHESNSIAYRVHGTSYYYSGKMNRIVLYIQPC